MGTGNLRECGNLALFTVRFHADCWKGDHGGERLGARIRIPKAHSLCDGLLKTMMTLCLLSLGLARTPILHPKGPGWNPGSGLCKFCRLETNHGSVYPRKAHLWDTTYCPRCYDLCFFLGGAQHKRREPAETKDACSLS